MKTIFEKSNNAEGISLTDEVENLDFLKNADLRQGKVGLPQLGELEVMRHYKELSDRNFCIEKGFYPLGSCTMKYNPKVNELLASLEGFTSIHPNTPDEYCQGSLKLMYNLQEELKVITGMDAITLQPAAGAHGELTGMMIIKKYFESISDKRKKVLIPDSAHGTNPASAHMCGFDIIPVKSNDKGQVDIDNLKSLLNKDVAAIMMTNPNTLGLFEENDISVIRVGLHDSESLKENRLAGPYHPAFKELCESRIMLDQAISLLRQKDAGKYTLRVSPQCRSKMTGNKKSNLLALKELGYEIQIREDDRLSYLEVIIAP